MIVDMLIAFASIAPSILMWFIFISMDDYTSLKELSTKIEIEVAADGFELPTKGL